MNKFWLRLVAMSYARRAKRWQVKVIKLEMKLKNAKMKAANFELIASGMKDIYMRQPYFTESGSVKYKKEGDENVG